MTTIPFLSGKLKLVYMMHIYIQLYITYRIICKRDDIAVVTLRTHSDDEEDRPSVGKPELPFPEG